MTGTVQLFLSYAREDRDQVRDLYQRLSKAGFTPWMDTENILPGERWASSIQRAIRRSDFFLVCLSENSVDKRGWIQKEIRQALDTWQGMLDSDIYLIPVRLRECQVPESLNGFQWVNLHEECGFELLIEALHTGVRRRAEQPALFTPTMVDDRSVSAPEGMELGLSPSGTLPRNVHPESKRDVGVDSSPFPSAASTRSSAPAPFVARERELAQLDGFLDQALTGQGRVVFVTGEAGTGKTALAREFGRRAQVEHLDLVVAGGNCNALTGIGDPYLPFRDILGLLTGDVESSSAAGITSAEGAQLLWTLVPYVAQLLLETSPDLIDTFVAGPILVDCATRATPGGARWLDRLREYVARADRDRGRAGLQQADLFEQYTLLLTTLAQRHPLLLMVDDLQWADAGSINLLFHLGRRLEERRILLVGIYRPAEVAWGRRAASSGERERHPIEPVIHEFQRRFGQIEVALQQTEDREFAEALVDVEPNQLGAEFRQAIYERTRGHALFTVEILRGMRERGDLVQDEAGRWIEVPVVDWESLPARVEGVIAEHFGRLPTPLQKTLKVASVEGENLTAEVVAQVQSADALEIIGQLGELDKRHRLLSSQSSQCLDPTGKRLSQYRFRHILFQEYVYSTLDEAERVYLHQAVGSALEHLYEGQTEAVALQLARHFHSAGQVEKALHYLRQAGERAVQLFANEEASAHFARALTLLEALPDNIERSRQELELQTALGIALMATKGHAAPEVVDAFTRAWDLCQQVEETSRLVPVLGGMFSSYLMRGGFQRTRKLAESFVRMAERAQLSALLVPAHAALGVSSIYTGEFGLARVHLEKSLSLYDPQRHRSLASLYGQDIGMSALVWLSMVLWLSGFPDQARDRGEEGLALAKSLSHPYTLVYALINTGAMFQLLGRGQVALERLQAAVSLAAALRFEYLLPLGKIYEGWVLALQGQRERGIAQMQQVMTDRQFTESEAGRWLYLHALADVHRREGQAEEGLAVLDEALSTTRRTGEHWAEGDLIRLKGELLLIQSGDTAAVQVEAEHCFHRAIELARLYSTKSLELRAAMSLSRLWQRQGKRAEACRMLAEVYEWFTEGFDTPDLAEARSLLEELT